MNKYQWFASVFVAFLLFAGIGCNQNQQPENVDENGFTLNEQGLYQIEQDDQTLTHADQFNITFPVSWSSATISGGEGLQLYPPSQDPSAEFNQKIETYVSETDLTSVDQIFSQPSEDVEFTTTVELGENVWVVGRVIQGFGTDNIIVYQTIHNGRLFTFNVHSLNNMQQTVKQILSTVNFL